jgi:hypothetical protein
VLETGDTDPNGAEVIRRMFRIINEMTDAFGTEPVNGEFFLGPFA